MLNDIFNCDDVGTIANTEIPGVFFTWKSQYFTDININHVYSQPSKYLLFYSWFVGPAITLQDCLAAFFSADELKGDNMYSCEKCKK